MKYSLFGVLLMFSFTSNGTAFSFGDGNYWKNICSGIHDELDKKGAIASCTMFLMGYQVGAYEQSRVSGASLMLCRKNMNPNTMAKEFINFVNSDKKYVYMDVLDVLREFNGNNTCSIQDK